MKTWKLLLALILLAGPACADVKISALPSLASPTGDDLTICVDSPSSNPITSKCTVGALQTFILSGNGSSLTGITVTQPSGSYTDVTTNNVTTSAHGLAPKLPNDATKYLDGTGGYTVPSNAAAGGFTDDGSTVRLTTAGDALAVGTATQNGSNKLTVQGGVYVSGTITGNATTASAATALAANGANCSAGSSPLGVDASGAVESCFSVVRPADIDTSAEIAALVTNETGTGSLVFNTAPTFSGTVTATAFVGDGSGLTGVGTSTFNTSSLLRGIMTDEVGTGYLVFNDSPSFTTKVNLPNAAAPTVSAFGDIAADNNIWASGRGAPIFYDGTGTTVLVGALSTDVPTNGQVPTWNTGGTITWETPSAGGSAITVADTQVLFSDGANNPVGDAGMTYNKTTNILSADGFSTNVSASAGYLQLFEASANGSNYRKFKVADALTGDATITLAGTDATVVTFPSTSQTLVGLTSSDTLTNKTLTAPVIATIVNSGTLTLPTSTDTLVGKATTDTLTNKTLTAPTVGTTLTMADAANIVINTSTGTKIGTGTTQKLAFYNSTPIVQPTGDACTALQNLGLVASCTGGGSGTVNTGTSGYFTVYPGTGTTVDDSALMYSDGTNLGFGTVPTTLTGSGLTATHVEIANNTSTGLVGLAVTSSTGGSTIRAVSDTTVKTPNFNLGDNNTASYVDMGSLYLERTTPIVTGGVRNDVILASTSNATKLAFATAGTVRMKIDNSGHVIVGASASHTSQPTCWDASGQLGYCNGGLAAACGTCTAL